MDTNRESCEARTESEYRCKMTNKYVRELVEFINVFQIFPNMFRQTAAIFKGS
jgi:hypothetical protein